MKPSWLSHVQVAAQLAGVAMSCYPVGLLNRGSAWWLLLCAFGTAIGLWALYHNRIGNFGIYPEPKPNTVLVTSGPYRLMRHPMYSALAVMMAGIAGYNGHWLNVLGLGVMVAAVAGKAGREEEFLASRFPEYTAYARATPRFIPFVY